ncbi:uncharacterized protein AB675_7080 [Cyphellophora attinorum]|uniref:Uncharacterized protein n=1 Tax=Cyphellophora attinorum TaxID=1664694 RepID=A0A0N0NPY8_9EURO|nr:uncharacterized protein AB675_7080 [Phialophora attinorum]KPI43288.1 hypothetical protein AB675_7080 [Phialophora attinorum]
MPAPPVAGAIIVASIIIAAGIAAYESDNIREWVEKTRQKIATKFDAISNDLQPRRPIPMRVRSTEASMTEEKGEDAEAKREKMRAQIAERARILEARSKRQRPGASPPQSPSFDSLVDHDGKLRSEASSPPITPIADTTAVETNAWAGELRSRRLVDSREDSEEGQLPMTQQNVANLEREMRHSFNISIPERSIQPSSHPSESLLDLTPTTEDFPDPDYSVPSIDSHDRQSQGYFSAAASDNSHTVAESDSQYYYAHPSQPHQPLDGRSRTMSPTVFDHPPSSAQSVAGSTSVVNPSEAEISEDDLVSEPDGIRTPGSAWTEVGSSVSGDDRLIH